MTGSFDYVEALQTDDPVYVEIVKLRRQNKALIAGIESIRSLIDHSDGVAGLHLNGDIADWASLQEAGRFESWLIFFNEAEDTTEPDSKTSDVPVITS